MFFREECNVVEDVDDLLLACEQYLELIELADHDLPAGDGEDADRELGALGLEEFFDDLIDLPQGAGERLLRIFFDVGIVFAAGERSDQGHHVAHGIGIRLPPSDDVERS